MRTVFALAFLLAACSPSEPPACRVGADCASGVCNGDGSCAPATDGGGGGTGGAATGSGGGSATGGGSGGGTGAGGGGAGGGSGGGTGGGAAVCTPNHDGTLTHDEVPLHAGLHGTFEVATNVTFDSTGDSADGGFTWNLAQTLSGDQPVLFETLALSGQWFANDFAGATYATRLSASSDLLGIFEVDADGLYLRGVASPMQSISATELTYTPPAKLLAFPMSLGTSWSTTSTVSGTFNGALWTQTEQYVSSVDKAGLAKTPFADFDVLRVKTVLTRTVGVVPTITRSYGFVTECFGNVASLTSQAGETSTEFTSQAEVRRLTQ